MEFMPIWGVRRFTQKHLIIEDLVLLRVASLLRSLISVPTSTDPALLAEPRANERVSR